MAPVLLIKNIKNNGNYFECAMFFMTKADLSTKEEFELI